MVDWELARNMAALRADVREKYPGVTIYSIGDTAHAKGRSGHNPDDTELPQGGTAELTDADDDPEVRALDFMIGPNFTATDARALVDALRDPRSLVRLYYIIYNRLIHRRDGSTDPYGGNDPHTNHVHASGWAGDDSNGAPWPAVREIGTDMSLETAELKYLAYTSRDSEALRNGTDNTDPDNVDPVVTGAPHWTVRTLKSMVSSLSAIGTMLTSVRSEVLTIKNGVAELVSRPPATSVAVDVAVVTAAMKDALQDPAVLAAVAKAINDDHARRMEQ